MAATSYATSEGDTSNSLDLAALPAALLGAAELGHRTESLEANL